MTSRHIALTILLTLIGLVLGAGIASASEPQEDSAGFNCATMGSHICGPTNTEGLRAGCYDSGTLVILWSNYTDPTADPLYARSTSPCQGQAPTQEQASDVAYAAAQVATVKKAAHSHRKASHRKAHPHRTASAHVRTEDGSYVAPSFYAHTTTTGATQARCDYLGKQRVPDPTYGHRCV